VAIQVSETSEVHQLRRRLVVAVSLYYMVNEEPVDTDLGSDVAYVKGFEKHGPKVFSAF
jgi:hypothetical protein